MPSRIDFAAALARSPEIHLVVTRGDSPGEVRLYGRGGDAVVTTEEAEIGPDLYSYRVLEGADPLGYSSSEDIRKEFGVPHDADWWLRATSRTEAPDLVVQLSEFFDSPRSPDVYLTPSPGYGFKFNRKAGHGSLARRELVVPMLFAGPGVPHGNLEVARTVDLAPTLLRYLGVDYDPDEMDGQDLAIELPEESPGRKIER
jgi:hypothetical protein